MNAALNNLRDARRTDPRAYTAIAEQEARLAWVRADTLKAHDDFNEMAGEVRKLRRDAKAETRVPA
ncbi:MAG: hypothetical protein C3F10_07195 [Dehalococcoidia bacterium]|nr:MAG: hypothetical protein C3F10_07195 [Dehalococcoidia bacterium]